MKNIYKIIIIDDDELSVDNLTFYLKAYTKFQVEGIARNGLSGKKLIFKTMPDLLFLDVELPDIQGYELLNQIRDEVNWNMQVVFYTAYNKYMLEAIRGSAFDYLLKPLNKEELSKMISRFNDKQTEQHVQTVPFHIQIRSLTPMEQTIIIPSPTNDLQFLRPENIGFFKYNSDRKVWEAFLNNVPTTVSLRKSICADKILSCSNFFIQVHQSHIININYLIMIKDKTCIFYPPFDDIRDVQISKLYLRKLQERFLIL